MWRPSAWRPVSWEPAELLAGSGSVDRRLPSSHLSLLRTWTAKRKDTEGHSYSSPWWELLFCESPWSAAILLGARWCWQSQRLALNLGAGVALSEAAQLLGTYGVMKPWMEICLSYLWPFSISGYRAGFREASGASEGEQGATLRCVRGRAGVPLSFCVISGCLPIADPPPEEAGAHLVCSFTSPPPCLEPQFPHL